MASITKRWRYEGSGASDSDCSPALWSNKPSLLTQVDSTEVSQVVSADPSPRIAFSWTTGPIGIADWPNGTYTISLRISRIPTNLFGQATFRRVNAGCSQQASSTDLSFFSTSGTYVFSQTINPTAGSKTDRVQILLSILKTSGADGALEVDVAHADSYLEGPLGTVRAGLWVPQLRRRRQRRSILTP